MNLSNGAITGLFPCSSVTATPLTAVTAYAWQALSSLNFHCHQTDDKRRLMCKRAPKGDQAAQLLKAHTVLFLGQLRIQINSLSPAGSAGT